MNTRYCGPDISFYSSDEYIKCLCVDQSGKKALENHIVCVREQTGESREKISTDSVEKRNYEWILLDH